MDVGIELTKSLPVSGVDTHLMLNFPGRFTMGLELDNWKAMVAWKPAPSSSTGLTSLYHYRVRPFTALQSTDDILPVTANPGELKDIRAKGVTPQSVLIQVYTLKSDGRVHYGHFSRINTRWAEERA